MIPRILQVPEKQSFFLFGPRGTGKSTWLKNQFQSDLTINLLRSEDFLRLSASPSDIRGLVEALPPNSNIVIDEIQKLPILLDEIHALLFDHQEKYRFALTGSSARKLKKEQANLLAGRAVNRKMFSIVSKEIDFKIDLNEALRFGALPLAMTLESEEEKKDYLYTYVDNYLKEEIQLEAAVRDLQAYHRYLKHAAIFNGQVLNVSNVSRDAAVARSTVDGYYKIVEETLLGFLLPAMQLKAKVKESVHPKFYFFDCGVIRALQNRLDLPISPEQQGHLFETYLINEIRAYLEYLGIRYNWGYWGTPSHSEVDLIVEAKGETVALEFKSTPIWKSEYSKYLKIIAEAKNIEKTIGVYTGKYMEKDDNVIVYPVADFLKALYSGGIV